MTALELRSPKTPPRVPGLPWVGALFSMVDTVRFFSESRRYGDVVYAKLFGLDMFLVYSPEVAEHVLVKNQKNYGKDKFMQRTDRIFGDGLLRAEGDVWRAQRRLIQPGFHKQRVRGYAETMLALSERAADALTPGTEVDFHRLMTAVTLEIAVQTMFGQSSNVDAAVVGKHLDAVMARFEAIGYLLEPYWWPSPSQVRCRRALAALDRIVAQYIEVRRAAPSDDVLSMLLETRDESGAPMSPKQLRDEVMTLFFAGQETTALALVFAWRLLALNQDVAQALHHEVAQVPRLDPETLPRLTLLDRVLKESLRLHPPAYGIPREALGADELGGYPISRGAQVVVALSAMHRDPRYFADPEAFRPERWTKEFEAALPRCAYLPFGAGPRMCIGAAFAELETKIALATFIRRFRPRMTSEGPLELISSLTQRPRHGLPVRLEAWDQDSSHQ